MNLFARLANDNLGYVDWTPYIPTVSASGHANVAAAAAACSLRLQIFTRILRSLNLPVGVNQMVAPRYLTNSYDIGHVVLWIAALLVRSVALASVCTCEFRSPLA